MERRKFMIGAGSTAIGASAIVGSGAFTSVEADRDISVEVEGDSDAFLGIEPAGEGNDNYVDDSGDTIALNFDDDADDVDGSGINDRALTVFDDLITVTNQGSQDVAIGVDFVDDGGNPVGDQASVGVGGPVLRLQEGGPGFADDRDALEPGESVNIGVFFNLSKDDDFGDVVEDLETMVIVADADEV